MCASDGHAPDAPIDGLLLGASAAYLAFGYYYGHIHLRGTVLGALAFVLAVFGLGVVTSWHPWVSFLGYPSAALPLVMFALTLAVSSSARALNLSAVVWGALLNVAVAAHQKLVSWPDAIARQAELDLPPALINRMIAGRPHGLAVSPDLFGALCLAGVFVAGSLLVTDERARLRVVDAVAALGCLLGIAMSRSAGVGLALGVGLAVALVLRTEGRNRIAAIAALALAPLPLLVFGRGLGALAGSASERVENWHAALALLQDQPLTGVGLFRFAPAYLTVRSPDSNVTRYAHSTLAQWSAELGVWGALAIAVLAVGIATLCWRRRHARATLSQALLGGGAAALLVRCGFDYDGQVAQNASVIAVVLGFALAPLVEPRERAWSPLWAITPGLLALGAVTMYLAGSDRERVMRPFGRDAAASAVDVVALREYADGHPGDLLARAVYAQHMVAQLEACRSDCDGTLEETRRAIALSLDGAHPSPIAYTNRARVFARSGDFERAFADLGEALRLDPGFTLAHALRLNMAAVVGAADRGAFLDDTRRWLHPQVASQLEAQMRAVEAQRLREPTTP